jgi:hypothetical protein
MTRPYLGGTPQPISLYTTPRDANPARGPMQVPAF